MSERPDKFELLCEYLDGTLAAERRAEVEHLLAREPEMRALLAKASEGRDALRSLPLESAPALVRQQIAATVASAQLRQARWSPARLMRIAAALLIAAALGLVAWSVLPSQRLEPYAAQVALRKTVDAESKPTALAAAEPEAKAVEKNEAIASRDMAFRGVPTQYYANAEATVVLRGPNPAMLGREVQSLASANNLAIEPALADEKQVEAIGQRAEGFAEGFAAAPPAALSPAASAAGKVADNEIEVVILRNASAEQVENMRTGLLQLARANNYRVVDMALGGEQARQRQQMSQVQRSMPSATPQALQRAMTEAEQRQSAAGQLYDVTIVIEPDVVGAQAADALARPAAPAEAAGQAAPAGPPAAAITAEPAPAATPALPAPAREADR